MKKINTKVLLHTGLFLHFLGRNKQAEKIVAKAYAINPKDFDVVAAYSDICDATGKEELSDRLIEEAYLIDPNDETICYNKANNELQKENIEEAVRLYEQVLEQNPKHVDALNYMGFIKYHYKEQPEDALDYLLRGLKIDKRNEHLLFNLAYCYELLENDKEAEFIYRLTEKVCPTYEAAFFNHGELLARKARYEEASVLFQKTIQINPESIEAMQSYAHCLEKTGKPEQAEFYYKKALDLNPNDPETLEYFIDYLKSIGRKDEAKELKKKLDELNNK